MNLINLDNEYFLEHYLFFDNKLPDSLLPIYY